MDRIFEGSNLLVKIGDIAEWAGVSRATVYRMQKKNGFPRPQKGLASLRDVRYIGGEVFEFFTGEARHE